MTDVRITDDELMALSGLSHFAFRLYVAGIRPHMDFRTGVVGVARRVSWQSLAEALYVESGQGIEDSGTPHKMRLRRAADRLVAAGLLSIESQGKRLIFRCLMAHTDSSARKKPDTNPTQTRHSKPDTIPDTENRPETTGIAEGNEKTRHDTRHKPDSSENGKPDTPPVSGIRNTEETSSLRSDVSSELLRAREPAAPAITIPLNTGDEHPVTDADVDEWSELYPAVDVPQALRNMRGWALANPKKRKTARGIRSFIANWLTREQDKSGGPPQGNPHETRQRTLSAVDRVREANRERDGERPLRVIEGRRIE